MKNQLNKKASMGAALIATNALIRHGHSVPVVGRVLHRVGKGVMHAGFQSGIRGEKGPHRLTRELIGTIKDPYHTALFEKSKEMGHTLREHLRLGEKKYNKIKANSRVLSAYDKYKPARPKKSFEIKKEHYDMLKEKFPHLSEHIDSLAGSNFDEKNDKLQQNINRGARWMTKDTTFGRFKRDVHSGVKSQLHKLHSDESSTRKPIHKPLSHVARIAWEDTKNLGLGAGEAIGGEKLRNLLNTDVRVLGRSAMDKLKGRSNPKQIEDKKPLRMISIKKE